MTNREMERFIGWVLRFWAVFFGSALAFGLVLWAF